MIVTVLRRSILLAACIAMLPLSSLYAQSATSGSGSSSSSSTAGGSGGFDKNDLKSWLSETIWYDPFANCGGGGGGGTQLQGGDNVAKVFNFFTGKGLSSEDAAAIVGNLQVESGEQIDPNAYNSAGAGGTGASIAQWEGERWSAFSSFAQGKDPKDLAVQLEFMWMEFNGTPPASKQFDLEGFKSTSGLEAKVKYFVEKYERAGVPHLERRVQYAQAALQKAGGGGSANSGSTPSANSSASSCPESSAGGAKGDQIANKAKELAWPDASHGITPSPAYQKALGEIGGGNAADCGVFVATVMITSGADKEYPKVGTEQQAAYVKQHSDKYEVLEKVNSTADLKPGDILIVNAASGGGGNGGHTFIFLGSEIAGGGFDAASASWNSRAANLDKAITSDNRGNYMVARTK